MFTLQTIQNLKWDNAEHTSFSCDVKYAEFNEVHPTSVADGDQHIHIQELWAKGNAGEYGAIAEYERPSWYVDPNQEQPSTQGSQDL
jgi:hypothetical protein